MVRGSYFKQVITFFLVFNLQLAEVAIQSGTPLFKSLDPPLH